MTSPTPESPAPEPQPLTKEEREAVIAQAHVTLADDFLREAHAEAAYDLRWEATVRALEALHAKHCGLECCEERDAWRPIESPDPMTETPKPCSSLGESGEAKPWSGAMNDWIAPFSACPRCHASLNWKESFTVFDQPCIGATCCRVQFGAPLEIFASRPSGERAPSPTTTPPLVTPDEIANLLYLVENFGIQGTEEQERVDRAEAVLARLAASPSSETTPSCLVCGLVRALVVSHMPTGVGVCQPCVEGGREFSRGPAAWLKRKPDDGGKCAAGAASPSQSGTAPTLNGVSFGVDPAIPPGIVVAMQGEKVVGIINNVAAPSSDQGETP